MKALSAGGGRASARGAFGCCIRDALAQQHRYRESGRRIGSAALDFALPRYLGAEEALTPAAALSTASPGGRGYPRLGVFRLAQKLGQSDLLLLSLQSGAMCGDFKTGPTSHLDLGLDNVRRKM